MIQIVGERAYLLAAPGLCILDCSDPDHIALLGTYESSDDPSTLFVEGDRAYLIGEKLTILDVTDPSH
jgi:hypothetical protein